MKTQAILSLAISLFVGSFAQANICQGKAADGKIVAVAYDAEQSVVTNVSVGKTSINSLKNASLKVVYQGDTGWSPKEILAAQSGQDSLALDFPEISEDNYQARDNALVKGYVAVRISVISSSATVQNISGICKK
ncbi:MAG TPA: hypothetical protein VN132_14900 [Bdellovibrio sp.]|nr:hypothetical protein [Bdellovibrio sp.]